MLAADTGSLYFEAVPVALRDIMWRVGASTRPAEFVAGVVDAWRAVEIVTEEQVQARFRGGRAYRDFRETLRGAARPGAKALAIGCGRGFAGRGSAYAASVIREIFSSAIVEVDRFDVTPESLSASGGPYDLVVTHSLLHFVYDFKPICRLIEKVLAPGGAYLMANEPNSRFWSNAECVREMKRVAAAESREKRLRKFVSPARYWGRIVRLGRPKPKSTDRVNAILRERFRLTGSLTEKEIVRIIDPHVPDPYPGASPIGADGMNWADFENGPLSGLRLDKKVTSGYVLRANPDRIPDRWRALDERLAAQFPLDGCSFTALWRKEA